MIGPNFSLVVRFTSCKLPPKARVAEDCRLFHGNDVSTMVDVVTASLQFETLEGLFSGMRSMMNSDQVTRLLVSCRIGSLQFNRHDMRICCVRNLINDYLLSAQVSSSRGELCRYGFGRIPLRPHGPLVWKFILAYASLYAGWMCAYPNSGKCGITMLSWYGMHST